MGFRKAALSGNVRVEVEERDGGQEAGVEARPMQAMRSGAKWAKG